MGKRKGDNVLVGAPSLMPNVSPTMNNMTNHSYTGPTQADWLDSASFDHKLWIVRESLKLEGEKCNREDEFIAEVKLCEGNRKAFQLHQEEMLEISQRIRIALTHKICQEEAKCEQESQNVNAMEDLIKEVTAERDSIQEDMVNLDLTRQNLEKRIAKAIEEANQEVEAIDLVEENRKNQVPRLKRQISLYASTTGIKWDFENDRLLEGHVVSQVSMLHYCNTLLMF